MSPDQCGCRDAKWTGAAVFAVRRCIISKKPTNPSYFPLRGAEVTSKEQEDRDRRYLEDLADAQRLREEDPALKELEKKEKPK